MRTTAIQLGLAVVTGLCALAALLLALFDWRTAAILIGSLVGGWLFYVLVSVARGLYRKHRAAFLGASALIAIVLLVVLRPDGASDDVAEQPIEISSYRAEVWPNRLANDGSFIVRERIGRSAGQADTPQPAPSDNRLLVEPFESGPLMHEVRFAAGAGQRLNVMAGGPAKVVVNPMEDGELHHAAGGALSRIELPMGDIATVTYDELPREIRLAYLIGAGRRFAPLAALVTPLRRMPIILVGILFALLGIVVTHAWAGRLVKPFVERKPQPPARKPGAPIERAPLIPRR